MNTIKVILFSPNGYIGGIINERIKKENIIQLYEMTRSSNLEKYIGHFDIMIYSASITSVRHETPERYVQDNVVTAINILIFCEKHSIKRIIYLSTDEIYGELNTDIVTERAVMVNPNLYAATKYLAEKIIIESGIPYYILRLPGVVGGVRRNNFINNLMDRIKKNERVEMYNITRNFNNIVDVYDLADFITKLCYRENDNEKEIFLLGNLESIKLIELVSYIKMLFHSTSSISNIDANDKRYFILDVSKAVEYGYTSKKIKTIIDELFQYMKG